jgi:hypothetical protein
VLQTVNHTSWLCSLGIWILSGSKELEMSQLVKMDEQTCQKKNKNEITSLPLNLN